MSGEETLTVPPGCRCVFGVEWAGGFDSDWCAAHGPAFATLTAQIETLEGEREELLTALNGIVEPMLRREDDPCAAFEENAAAFYATYHMLAPGKSEPLELANDERDAKRHNIWRDWCNHRRIEAIGRYRAARALVRRVRGGT